MTKQELRSKYKLIRRCIPAEIRETKSELIAQRLLSSEQYKSAHTIMCYAALGSEVNTDSIIKTSLDEGKRLLLPICDESTLTMTAHLIGNINELKYGTYGIREPEKLAKLVCPADIDLVIVPALCYDKQGYRIGYGKGFYDKFLLQCVNGTTIGLAYSECICEDICHDKYDVPIAIVITDDKIYRK